MSISDRDELVKNPDIEQVVCAPRISYSGVSKKPDSGFRDVLKRIKKANIRSNINTF